MESVWDSSTEGIIVHCAGNGGSKEEKSKETEPWGLMYVGRLSSYNMYLSWL